jgi:hypothetical protein
VIDAYFASLLQTVAASPAVISSSITLDQRSAYIGLVRGDVYFLDGSVLHVREFVNTQSGVDRYMYVFHYQRADGAQVFRYDNTDHYPELPTAPHHKHLAEGIPPQSTTPPDLALVLKEIELLIAATR